MKVKFWAELAGTAFLVMIVFGSGVMGQKLFPNQLGLVLLVNSIATGAGLFVLIQSLGSISGAHLNPSVSLAEFFWGRLSQKDLLLYVLAQMLGAYLGVVATHVMFDVSPFVISQIERPGMNLLFSEVIATFGLIAVIALSGKKHVEFAPLSVASYIAAGYWFTSSTAFTNPAVTFARMFTNVFSGMAPAHFFHFVIAQIVGAALALVVLKPLAPLYLSGRR
ncbi:MAG: aquaporin [Bacteriovoracaceae bacterium]